MNVSLAREQKSFVEQRVATGGYGNVSDYVRDLIRRDQKELAQAELETKLLASLESGKPIPVTSKFWNEKRAKLLALHKKSSKS
ncbi:MAG: type II toxin-antitoxin system ParD family antitoxin [Planctomycetota bacterium]